MLAQMQKQGLWERVDKRFPEIYLALALPLALLLCWMTPPFFAPDEASHADREISLAHGHLIERMGPEGAGDDIDDGMIQVSDAMDNIRMQWEMHAGFFLDRSYGPVTDDQQLNLVGKRWSRRTAFEEFENTAVYPPPLYLPATAGWRLGEAANWTVFASLRLARLMCALCAVALGWLALRFCVGVRCLLILGLLLPSVLYLNATCCQDALVPGVAALAVAMLSRALAARRNFTCAELLIVTASLCLIALARPPYVVMTFMLFLPAAELRANWRTWIAPGIASVAIATITATWWHRVSNLRIAVNDLGEPAKQRSFVLTHPLAASLSLLRGTSYAAYDFLHRGLYVVGLNDLLPHHGAAAALMVCLFLVVLAAHGPVVKSWQGKLLLAVSVLGPLLGVSLAEYLIWTSPGGVTVFGIMPRYWFAAMPLGILLLQSLTPRRAQLLAVIPRQTAMFACALVAVITCTLPWMVSHAFYREGVLHVLRLNLR